MGLINHDTKTLENGLEIKDTYVCVKDLRVVKKPAEYHIYNTASEYISKKAKEDLKPAIEEVQINFQSNTLPETMTELYAKAYDEIKLFFKNTTDC